MPQLQRPAWDLCLAWAVGSKHCALQRLGVRRQLASPPGPATGAKPWQVAGRAVLGTVLGPWPLASLPLWFSSTLEMSPESPNRSQSPLCALCPLPHCHGSPHSSLFLPEDSAWGVAQVKPPSFPRAALSIGSKCKSGVCSQGLIEGRQRPQ